MTSEEGLDKLPVDEVVDGGDSGVVIARSRPRPMLQAALTCSEGASDLPDLVCKLCEASFGRSAKSYADISWGLCTGACRRER